MFIGEYQHSIDNKGRLQVPAKLRRELGQGAVVTRGIDNCLFLYSKQAWLKLADKLSKLPIGKASTRALARLMLAGAMDVEIDNQGRMLVPDYLRHYAKLKKSVVVAGLYSRLEIWDQANWTQYKKGTEKTSASIAESLGDLGV
ncbi:MAG: division/cell wall cluster transcriptional repressor MraZ [Patescibacteria group bacterium]